VRVSRGRVLHLDEGLPLWGRRGRRAAAVRLSTLQHTALGCVGSWGWSRAVTRASRCADRTGIAEVFGGGNVGAIFMADTIFDRYGGFAAVRRVVSDFYDRALDSPVIGHHFEHIDMKRLLDHQARFVSSTMGGPASYTDEHLRRVHERLGITAEEFREMLALLTETLEDHAFEQPDIDVIASELRRRQGVIVTR
jgi:hemoglobin